MPYMVNASNSGRYYTTFETDLDCRAALKLLDQSIQGKKPWKGWPAIFADLTLPAEVFPCTAHESQGRKQLYDFLNLTPRTAVSGEFKEIVEHFEPDVHQFSGEIEVFYKDGRQSEKKYYGLQMRGYLDNTIVPEKSFKVTGSRRVDGAMRYSGTGLPDSFYLDERAIQCRHFWAAHDLTQFWFMSDEMMKATKKAKIMGLEFKHQLSGPR